MKPHNIVTSKSYEKIIADLQAKKWYTACKTEYDSQVEEDTFSITILPYNYKAKKKNEYSNLKKIRTALLKGIRPDRLLKNIDR